MEFLRDRLYKSIVFPQASLRVELCKHCAQVSTWTSTSIVRFERATRDCFLHELLIRACGVRSLETQDYIEMRRGGSNLFLNGYSSPVLSLCRSPRRSHPVSINCLTSHNSMCTAAAPDPMPATHDTQTPQPVLNEIQIGFPNPQQVSRPMYLDLISHWLQDCNDNHPQCSRGNNVSRSSSQRVLPTRLIHVGQQFTGSEKEDDRVRLLSTAAIPENELQTDARYIALSHPWGSKLHNDHFCTTRENIASRIQHGIAVPNLPATLRDAIIVTRALGIRYLWIDTICIIQGPAGDFNTEARLMETVFSLAYCVIAASRASGTSSGFLSPRRSRDFVALNLPSTNNTLYITTPLDNFQSDVISGPLNKRGWVLQERALARRTIYFTSSQTYFECGAGVRCETLTKMTNNQASFLGDPAFPTVALKSSKGAKIRLYEILYKMYSALEFTKMWDRPIAIAGLEQRLVWAFGTHGGYGVFGGQFFGRSLLWKRDGNAEGNEAMKTIEFPVGDRRYYHVPTWSWMAYEGVIGFLEIPFDGVEWRHGEEEGVVSPWVERKGVAGRDGEVEADAVWHTGKADEQIVLSARGRELAVSMEEARRKIVYDAGVPPGNGVSEVRVVIVGRQKTGNRQAVNVGVLQHYVLVVGQRQESGVGTARYERLGVAALPGSWIDLKGLGKKISIV